MAKAPTAVQTPEAETKSEQPETSSTQASAPEPVSADGRKPFFSVPYAMRAPIQKNGPSKAESFTTSVVPQSPPGPQTAPQTAPQITQPVEQPVSAEEPAPAESSSAAGKVSNAVEMADMQKEVEQPADVVPQKTPSLAGTSSSEVPRQPPGPSLRMKAVKKTLKQMLADAEHGVGDFASTAGSDVAETSADIRKDVSTGGELGQDITSEAEAGKEAEAVDIAMENATSDTGTVPAEDQAAPPMDNATVRRIEIETDLDQANSLIMADNYKQAVDLLEPLLKDKDFPENMREETLYTLASAKFQLYKDDLSTHYNEVTGAFDRAINFNPKSMRVPEGLLNLGLINMKVGNIPEAGAYFNILKKKYPDDDNIPYIEYYWGQYNFDKGDYRKAADRFQYLVQTYPDSKVVREASLGLANSLDHLGFEQQAYQIVDYIDKRWPRYYVESPEFLRLSGNIANKLDKFDKAKSDYWTFYNLTPDAPDMDIILARIGDIYLREKKPEAAKDVYSFTAKNYPDSQGGLVSNMRLAEEGIYDDPDMNQMFTVFDRPYNVRPVEIYTKIVKKFPKSALAPLAQLKLAMWYIYVQQPAGKGHGRGRGLLQTLSQEFACQESPGRGVGCF